VSGLDAVFARAGGFLAIGAHEIERLHFETLLRERDAGALFAALERLQEPDGSIREWRRDESPEALTPTLRALGYLDGLGLLDHPVPEAAIQLLSRLQAGDGGWGAPSDPPDDRIVRTGAIAGFLAKSPFARPRALRAAEAFLLSHWSVERVQGPSYAPILAYLQLLTSFSSDTTDTGDEVLQWCGRELERGFRMQAFDPVSVARVFCRSRARALPGARLEPPELVTALVTAQEQDGAWTAEGVSRVDATLDAVEALQRLR